MRALHVLGRTIFGGFFVYSGIHHFQDLKTLRGYAAMKGVAVPTAAVQMTGALFLAGGLSVLAGVKPRQGLAVLIACLVPVTVQMHRFWDVEDPQQRVMEMTNFSKNMALVGAALALLQVREPWPASIDGARRAEEMYVRLGGRDLRALPA
jgi:putative oxidoreductase